MIPLLNSHRERFYQILVDSGIKPNDLEWRKAPGSRSFGLFYKGTDYHFSISMKSNDYVRVKFSPGRLLIKNSKEIYQTDEMFHYFQDFANALKHEVGAFDPWEELKLFSDETLACAEAGDGSSSVSIRPINKVENETLFKALDEIQATLLKHAGNSEERQEYVNAQFKVLRDAGEHFGRKDYLMLIYSTILGVCTALGTTPETIHQIHDVLQSTVAPILHFR